MQWFTAPLGAGKTALAAKIASSKGCVVASHFFNPANKISLDIRKFVLSLSYQVCA